MRYITAIIAVFGIAGCSAISDFAGYTFGEEYAPDGGAAGYDPYQGYAGAAGGFEPLAGAGGAAGALAGQGGAAGRLEPQAGIGGQAGEPWVEPEPDAGQVEPEPDAGQVEPDAGVEPEPDAGQVEPDTMVCQPCIDDLDCRGVMGEQAVCTSLVVNENEPRVCLLHRGDCPYGLVLRSGDVSCFPGVGCIGYCVPQDEDCKAWLDARGY